MLNKAWCRSTVLGSCMKQKGTLALFLPPLAAAAVFPAALLPAAGSHILDAVCLTVLECMLLRDPAHTYCCSPCQAHACQQLVQQQVCSCVVYTSQLQLHQKFGSSTHHQHFMVVNIHPAHNCCSSCRLCKSILADRLQLLTARLLNHNIMPTAQQQQHQCMQQNTKHVYGSKLRHPNMPKKAMTKAASSQ